MRTQTRCVSSLSTEMGHLLLLLMLVRDCAPLGYSLGDVWRNGPWLLLRLLLLRLRLWLR